MYRVEEFVLRDGAPIDGVVLSRVWRRFQPSSGGHRLGPPKPPGYGRHLTLWCSGTPTPLDDHTVDALRSEVKPYVDDRLYEPFEAS